MKAFSYLLEYQFEEQNNGSIHQTERLDQVAEFFAVDSEIVYLSWNCSEVMKYWNGYLQKTRQIFSSLFTVKKLLHVLKMLFE